MEGYIFINGEGKYAVENTCLGFGPSDSKTISWTNILDDATVFRTVTPWTSKTCGGSHCTVLKYTQSLRAIASRKVTIHVSEEGSCNV